MPEAHFTVESANAILPEVRDRLEKLRDAYALISGHKAKMSSLAGGNGGDSAAGEWIEAGRESGRQLGWFADNHIMVRDIESGLVDFPSERAGEEIFLCWRAGEESVAFWHDASSGFAGRRPID